MKVVIPAKSFSTRVSEKNWRPFYEDENLVEIKIKQVIKSISASSVYLSCDEIKYKNYAEKHGINFILRKKELASDSTSWSDAFAGMINETPVDENEDIAWVEVINPLFDDYKNMFDKWERIKSEHDCMVLAAPFSKFLLTEHGKPYNFQFGKWHAMSQNLNPLYTWDSACIMNKKNMLYFNYPIGKKPFIFSTGNNAIDIDTITDFEIAQIMYSKKHGNKK